MSTIRIACQTYTWEMLGDAWRGQVTDLLDWIADAGYEGVEITNTMIREFGSRPQEFAAELGARGLELACFAYARPSGFTDPGRFAEDLAGARKTIEFARHFPRPIVGLGGAAHPSRDKLWAKLDQAIRFYAEVGRLGAHAGVRICVHPHSHFGSLLESAEEYQYLLDRLDPQYVGLCPDTGHIVRGGQDLLSCLRTHLPRIIHVHFKDVDSVGRWAGLGQGLCDFATVLRLLESVGYDGWVVSEEESEDARRDGVGAIRRNREYLRGLGH